MREGLPPGIPPLSLSPPWTVVDRPGIWPLPQALLDPRVPGGYQEGLLEGAASGLGKREGLYIHFLFLPQRNRRWPRGLEGDFRASMGEDVMACGLTAPDPALLLSVYCQGLPEHLQLLLQET